MNMRRAFLLLPIALVGCLSPAATLPIRWFVPPIPAAEATTATDAGALELDGVRADAHLDERMLLRASDVELFPDELHRWIARPAVFAEQALRDALFARGGHHEQAGEPRLRVQLRGFEAALTSPPRVIVEWDCSLTQGDATLHTTIHEELDIDDPRPETIARGLGVALAAAATRTAAWVSTARE